MDIKEVLKQASQTIDEIETLRKSYEDKMKKNDKEEKEENPEAPEAAPEAEEPSKEEMSDAQADLLHQADEHGSSHDDEDLANYTKNLSDDELYELMESLSQEAESRGMSDEMDKAENPEAEAAPQEEMEKEAEEQDSEEGDIHEKVASLSDEELEMLMGACEVAMANRKKDSEESKEEDMDKMMPAAASYMMKSMKAESDERFESLVKSLETIAGSVEDLSKKVETLSAKKIAPPAAPAQKYSDAKVKVLEKSAPAETEEPLTGAELQGWLLEQQRARVKGVNSDLIARAGLTKSVEQAAEFYAGLKNLGLNPPRKKN